MLNCDIKKKKKSDVERLPIKKPAPCVHPDFGVNLLRRVILGFKKTTYGQSAAHRFHTAPQNNFKALFFSRLKFKNAVFVTYLIEGHYKTPKDCFIPMRLNKVVLKKGKLEPSKLIHVTTTSSSAHPDTG